MGARVVRAVPVLASMTKDICNRRRPKSHEVLFVFVFLKKEDVRRVIHFVILILVRTSISIILLHVCICTYAKRTFSLSLSLCACVFRSRLGKKR